MKICKLLFSLGNNSTKMGVSGEDDDVQVVCKVWGGDFEGDENL